MNEGILIQIGKSVRLDHTLKKTGISNFKININAINFKHSTLVQESIDGIDDFTQWEHSKEDDMTFFVDPRIRLENEIASFNHRILILILIILLIITTVASGILIYVFRGKIAAIISKLKNRKAIESQAATDTDHTDISNHKFLNILKLKEI